MPRLFSEKKCFIIAEISANHGQSLRRAIELIKKAKEAGADAVKFQTYTPQTMTLDLRTEHFMIDHPKWGGQSLFELYGKAQTPWAWFKELKKTADDAGILFFSTPFDRTAADFLEDLGVQLFKIASFELVDIPLISYVASKERPMIMSTGMASKEEIKEALDAARKCLREIALLKCVSCYPAKPSEMNLKTIPDMQKEFGVPIGLSDHTLGTGVSVAAVALGARIIEKHITLSRKMETPDSFFSLEPDEFKELVANIRLTEEALGEVHYGLTKEEEKSKVFRRSLFISREIKKGQKLTEDSIQSIRPAYGLAPKYLNEVIGKKAKKAIKAGTPLSFDLLE